MRVLEISLEKEMRPFSQIICVFLLTLLANNVTMANEPEFARFYQLTGIASGDVLNVRSGPSTRNRVIGKLTHDAGTLEILERDPEHQWGRIVWEGGMGWVFLEFVSPVSPEMVPSSDIPINLHCSGADPYWDYSVISETEVMFKVLFDDSAENTKIQTVVESANSANEPTALIAQTEDIKLTALLDTQLCEDVATGRRYGWSIDLLVEQQGAPKLFSGCCSL